MIDSIGTRKATGDFFLSHPFHIAATFYISDVFINSGGLLCRLYFFYEFMLGCYHHEVNAKDGVWASGVHFQLQRLTPSPSPPGEGCGSGLGRFFFIQYFFDSTSNL